MHRNNQRADAKLVTDELHLRRLTVDEALPKLDKYLNDAFVAGLYQVTVIHGKGTGTLRQVVREQLAKHPLVESYRPGEYGEGGAGVTIVTLA
jgi:DNA mismatch repair protein MutS2